MLLLKIGDRVLNVDRVTEFTVGDTSVVVRFGPGDEVRFTRHDAVLLRQWLDRLALDPAAEPPARDGAFSPLGLARGRDPRR